MTEEYGLYIPNLTKIKEFKSLPLDQKKRIWRLNNKIKNIKSPKTTHIADKVIAIPEEKIKQWEDLFSFLLSRTRYGS